MSSPLLHINHHPIPPTSTVCTDKFNIDFILFISLLILIIFGSLLLYSATKGHPALLQHHFIHLGLGLLCLLLFAKIPPEIYQKLGPAAFWISLALLGIVLAIGLLSKGAQRWLGIGALHFQPAELMKLTVPLMLASYLDRHPLPPRGKPLITSFLLIVIPVILVAKQPDLGTALVIAGTGISVLLLAGVAQRVWYWSTTILLVSAPILWHMMHSYQRERLLTFLNPERSPLGSGYHILQSKIAIGSGGLLGKGWLHGTQSHLKFLPENTTDFIFSVCAEEFGFLGCLLLISIILFITLRSLYISVHAQTTFRRLIVGSLALTFFISATTNIGMVTGLLPVVGVPLPFVSYGGSALLINLASFGVIMGVSSHRRLV